MRTWKSACCLPGHRAIGVTWRHESSLTAFLIGDGFRSLMPTRALEGTLWAPRLSQQLVEMRLGNSPPPHLSSRLALDPILKRSRADFNSHSNSRFLALTRLTDRQKGHF